MPRAIYRNNSGQIYAKLKWILEPEPCEPGPPVPLTEDLLTSPDYVHSDTPIVWLRHALSLSDEAIKRAALETTGQRDNPMWSIVRKYRITASNFGAVLCSKQRRLTLSLKKQLMSAYNLESIKAVAWGITREDDALRKYEKDFDAAVEQSDLKQDTLCLKTSHPYYHQIQGQLHICNKTCCDLIVWTRVDCIVIRIVKDIEWTANVSKLIDFYFNIFIPALMEN
ncbi:uncharacterized protein LOC134233305 [Saccostrea cucullata]|uniref:uncharacterized protein LOC134233305 n=1 Tax=Saccostrea cuccullata TaxID=36930 RepID=UPI002ED53350